jgi:hypothetical protein
MSQPDFESVSVPSVVVKKPQLTIYTVLLVIALVSLLLACLFLYLEIRAYGGFGAAQGRIAAVSQPIADAAAFWA